MAFVEFQNVGKTYHMGEVEINALHDADLQMLKALVILSSILFVVINLLTDIAYAYVDPRMRPEK